jgi:hypothetical protein
MTRLALDLFSVVDFLFSSMQCFIEGDAQVDVHILAVKFHTLTGCLGLISATEWIETEVESPFGFLL